jgi:hypothetical protein
VTSRAILLQDAVVELLNTDLPSDMPSADKRYLYPMIPLEGPKIVVLLNQEAVRPAGGNTRSPLKDRERMLLIQLAAISEDGNDLDERVEELRAWVVSRLGDTNLGNLALSVEERNYAEPPWRYKLDRYHIVANTQWAARYQTRRDDLEAAQ